MAIYDIVESSTNNVVFQLLEAGAPIDLTGINVTLLLEDRTGATVPSPGVITVIDPVNGKVRLTPANTSVFIANKGPYAARWELRDSFNAISFVPTSNRDIWNVVGL